MSADKNLNYTCNDYRQEMILLGLKMRLNSKELSKEERKLIKAEIKRLEKELKL